MKTFRLISATIVTEAQILSINLQEGLIINKEDDNNHWLIDLYTDKQHKEFLENCYKKQHELLIHVIITKKENAPAPFITKIRSLHEFDHSLSILLEGVLKQNRKEYAEVLLEHLVNEEGLSGEPLMQEFKKLINSKPQLFLEKNK